MSYDRICSSFNHWFLNHFHIRDGPIPFSKYCWLHYQMLVLPLTSRMVPFSTFVLPGNAMMVLTPFVSLMTTPYMVLVGMLSSRIGEEIMPWIPRTWRRKGAIIVLHACYHSFLDTSWASPNFWNLRSCLPHQVQSLGWIGGAWWVLAPSDFLKMEDHRQNTELRRIGCWKVARQWTFLQSILWQGVLRVPQLESCLRFLIWISCWKHENLGLTRKSTIESWTFGGEPTWCSCTTCRLADPWLEDARLTLSDHRVGSLEHSWDTVATFTLHSGVFFPMEIEPKHAWTFTCVKWILILIFWYLW